MKTMKVALRKMVGIVALVEVPDHWTSARLADALLDDPALLQGLAEPFEDSWEWVEVGDLIEVGGIVEAGASGPDDLHPDYSFPDEAAPGQGALPL